MENKKIILVPTDFSDVCVNAVNYGAKLASLMGWSLIILHIIDKKSKTELKKKDLTYVNITKELDIIAKETASKFSIEVTPFAIEGNIFNAIGKFAIENRVGMVVLGTHGMVDLKQKVSVSNAKKVVVSCPVPVIVIQKNSDICNNLKNIIFPVSTTAEVRQKVKWASILANAFDSVIHIFQFKHNLPEDKAKLKVMTSQINDEFDIQNIKFINVMAKSGNNYGKEVLAYANESKADLICIITTPISVNFTLHAYEKLMFFNKFEIPIMCINPLETTTVWK